MCFHLSQRLLPEDLETLDAEISGDADLIGSIYRPARLRRHNLLARAKTPNQKLGPDRRRRDYALRSSWSSPSFFLPPQGSFHSPVVFAFSPWFHWVLRTLKLRETDEPFSDLAASGRTGADPRT